MLGGMTDSPQPSPDQAGDQPPNPVPGADGPGVNPIVDPINRKALAVAGIGLGVVIVGFLVAIIIIAQQRGGPVNDAVGAAGPSDSYSSAAYSAPAPEMVRYEVDGDGGATGAMVTYATPDGQQQHTIDLPMTNQAGGTGVQFPYSDDEFLYVSAQNQDEYGSITCRIYVGDQKVSENTSSGAYAIATCQGP